MHNVALFPSITLQARISIHASGLTHKPKHKQDFLYSWETKWFVNFDVGNTREY